MRFIGLDLTDPWARRPRDVDVALVDERGNCEFAALPGDDVRGALGRMSGPRNGDVLIIDGPLGLAAPGSRLRECERVLATAGKTPDVLPLPGTRPYAGFVRGSVELAMQLNADGWAPAADGVDAASATMLEAYPGCSWRALSGARLPRKTTGGGVPGTRASSFPQRPALPRSAADARSARRSPLRMARMDAPTSSGADPAGGHADIYLGRPPPRGGNRADRGRCRKLLPSSPAKY